MATQLNLRHCKAILLNSDFNKFNSNSVEIELVIVFLHYCLQIM